MTVAQFCDCTKTHWMKCSKGEKWMVCKYLSVEKEKGRKLWDMLQQGWTLKTHCVEVRPQRPHSGGFYLYEMSRGGKPVRDREQIRGSQGLEGRGNGEQLRELGFLSGWKRSGTRLGMAAQLREHTKHQWIELLKWGDFAVCKLYLDSTVYNLKQGGELPWRSSG